LWLTVLDHSSVYEVQYNAFDRHVKRHNCAGWFVFIVICNTVMTRTFCYGKLPVYYCATVVNSMVIV